MRHTWGSETSQYPEEKKSTEIPLVVANERGVAQTILFTVWGMEHDMILTIIE